MRQKIAFFVFFISFLLGACSPSEPQKKEVTLESGGEYRHSITIVEGKNLCIIWTTMSSNAQIYLVSAVDKAALVGAQLTPTAINHEVTVVKQDLMSELTQTQGETCVWVEGHDWVEIVAVPKEGTAFDPVTFTYTLE